MTDNTFSFQDALPDPDKFYDDPKSLAKDDRFTVEQRRKLLLVWQTNEEALLRAAGEGLDGGERPHLKQVMSELEKLEHREG